MRHIIIHYHIFKNAGSTLDQILQKNFGEAFDFYEGDTLSTRIKGKDLVEFATANPGLQAISSHLAQLPAPTHRKIIFHPLLFIRHPIDRIGSIYSFERRELEVKTESIQVAREQEIAKYLKWYLSSPAVGVITNFQTSYLSGNNIEDSLPTSTDLKRAKKRLRELRFFGIVECFDESLFLMREYLQDTFGKLELNYSIENKSRERKATLHERLSDMKSQLGARLYNKLIRVNAMDVELYEYAVCLFNDKMSFQAGYRTLYWESRSDLVQKNHEVRILTEETVNRGQWGMGLMETIKDLQVQLINKNRETESLMQEAHQLRGQISEMVTSVSWKITLPLRLIKRFLTYLIEQIKTVLP